MRDLNEVHFASLSHDWDHWDFTYTVYGVLYNYRRSTIALDGEELGASYSWNVKGPLGFSRWKILCAAKPLAH